MSIVESYQRAHIERQLRFARAAMKHMESKAVPAPVKLVAVSAAPVDVAAPDEAWAERQVERFKKPWFQIIEGPASLDNHRDRKPPEIKTIQRIVGRHYLMSVADINSARKTNDIVRPRQVAMYLCKHLTHRSLPEIGRRFGNRDHTTVLHAVRKIAIMVARDPHFAVEIDEISKKCEAA